MPQMSKVNAKTLLAKAELPYSEAYDTNYFANGAFVLEIPDTDTAAVKSTFAAIGKTCPASVEANGKVSLNFSGLPFYFVEIADFFPAAKQELMGKARQYARNNFSIQPLPNSDKYNFSFNNNQEKQAFINSMGLLDIDLRTNVQNDSTITVSDRQLKDIGKQLGMNKANMLDSDRQLLAKARVSEAPQDNDELYFERGSFILEIPNTNVANVEATLKRTGFSPLPIIKQQGDTVTINIAAGYFAGKVDYFPQVKSQLNIEAGKYCNNKISQLSALTRNSCSLSFENEDKKQAFINNMRFLGLDLRKAPLKSTDALSMILTDDQLKAIDKKLDNPPRDLKNFHKQLNQARLVDSLTGRVFQSEFLDRNDEPFIELQLDTDKIKADEIENFVIYLKEVIGLKSARVDQSQRNDIVLIDAADYDILSNLDSNPAFLPSNELPSPDFSTLCRYLKHPEGLDLNDPQNPNDPEHNLIKSAKQSLQDIITTPVGEFSIPPFSFYQDAAKELIGVKLSTPSHAQYFRDVLHLEDNTKSKILYLTPAEFNRVVGDSDAFKRERDDFLSTRKMGLQPLKNGINDKTLRSNGSHFSLIIEDDKAREEFLVAARLAGVELKTDAHNERLVNISNSDYENLAPFIERGLPKANVLHAHYREENRVISASGKQAQTCMPLKDIFTTILHHQNYPEGLDTENNDIIITSQHADFAEIKQACELSFPNENFGEDSITLTEEQINHFLANPQNRPANNIKKYTDLQSESIKNESKLQNENAKQAFRARFKDDIENKVGLSSLDKDHFLLTFNSEDDKNEFIQGINKFGQKIVLEDSAFDPNAVILASNDWVKVQQAVAVSPSDMKTLRQELATKRLLASIDSSSLEFQEAGDPPSKKVRVQLNNNIDADLFEIYLKDTVGLKSAKVNGESGIVLDATDFRKLVMLGKVDPELAEFCGSLSALLQITAKTSLNARLPIFADPNAEDILYSKNGINYIGIKLPSTTEASFFHDALGLQEKVTDNILYLTESEFNTHVANINSGTFSQRGQKFLAQRRAGLAPLQTVVEFGAGSQDLWSSVGGSYFTLIIADEVLRKQFIDTAKSCGVILNGDSHQVNISNADYEKLAQLTSPPLPMAKTLHATLNTGGRVIATSNKQGLYCEPLKQILGMVSRNEPLPDSIGLDGTDIVISRENADFAAIKQACELSFPDKKFDDQRILLTEDQINHFLGNPQNRPAENFKNYSMILDAKENIEDFEPAKARLKTKVFERNNLTAYCHFYKRDNDIVLGLECQSAEEANYFRTVLDIDDGEKGNMLYLDSDKFETLFVDVSFQDVRKQFVAERNAGLEPLKQAMENGQLRNEKSGFSLVIDNATQQERLIAAAKKFGVTLTTEENKLLISDTQYAQLAAPFTAEKLWYLPPDATQAHDNCDASDLCRRINFTADAKAIKISGGTVFQLPLNGGADKEEAAKFLKGKFGLTSAVAAKSGDAIELSQRDYQALLALSKTKYFEKHKQLIAALEPLQKEHKFNVLNNGQKKPMMPRGNTTPKEDSVGFATNGEKQDSKDFDMDAATERMGSLDVWIEKAQGDEKRARTGIGGNPHVAMVSIFNPAPEKTGQFIYDTRSGVIKAEGDNRKPEIFNAMLEVLDLKDPVVEVVVKSSVNATLKELEASLDAAAKAFIAAIDKGLIPIVDESSPFTQREILVKVGKLDEKTKNKYDILKEAPLDPKLKEDITKAEDRQPSPSAKKATPESGKGPASNDDKDSSLSSDNKGSSINF